MKTHRKIQVTATVETPVVPNFIKQTDGQIIPLCAISEEGLRGIGEAWTDCLIERAKEQSRDPDLHYRVADATNKENKK